MNVVVKIMWLGFLLHTAKAHGHLEVTHEEIAQKAYELSVSQDIELE